VIASNVLVRAQAAVQIGEELANPKAAPTAEVRASAAATSQNYGGTSARKCLTVPLSVVKTFAL